MRDNLRDMLDSLTDEDVPEVNAESFRSTTAWVLDSVPMMQRLAEALEGLAFACDHGDADEIEGAIDAARNALEDVEGHGIMLD